MIRVGEGVTEEERDALELADAGEGAQPLRQLTCGHVFHVSLFRTSYVPFLVHLAVGVDGRCRHCGRC